MPVSRLFFLGAGTKVKEAENRYHQAFDRSKKHHLSEICRKDKGGRAKTIRNKVCKKERAALQPLLSFF
jgi:hypothetical protein